MRRVFVATEPLPRDGVNTQIGVYKVVTLCPSVVELSVPTEPPSLPIIRLVAGIGVYFKGKC
jgi:hypothetical protein